MDYGSGTGRTVNIVGHNGDRLGLLREPGDFLRAPHVVRDPRFHGRRDPERLMNPREVVPHGVKRDAALWLSVLHQFEVMHCALLREHRATHFEHGFRVSDGPFCLGSCVEVRRSSAREEFRVSRQEMMFIERTGTIEQFTVDAHAI